LLEPGYDIHTIQELPGRKDIGTAMIRTHVLNKGDHGVLKPDRQDLNRFMQTA
jgi:site-specific recombinase XerD